MKLSVGSKVMLQSYKHDHSLHRIWEKATILTENDEFIVVANKRTKVIESNGRFWYTKEPSVSYFFKDHWYNVIGIIKPTGISYYCNLSSPILYDEEALKYIDYDLDVRVLADGSLTVLDRNEYKKHQCLMQYPKTICEILEAELDDLKNRIHTHKEPFLPEYISQWYKNFLEMKEQ
ncbi:MAG: DUF402 domain-containing protein [Firmicutes bacterium]|nr:DUF402 domain-containing protein [Bacillota bacterium]